jgi:hypothetical protein
MKLLTSGSWWLTSKLDPRWNTGGSCDCGGFVQPQEAKDAIERLTNKLGDPPKDLEWGYMKD